MSFEHRTSNFKLGTATVMLAVLLLAGQAWAQSERILSYDSKIAVNSDASLTVSETIDVVANGDQIRHGIYRDFPTKYKGDLGKVTVVGFKIVQVLRDGKQEPYHIANMSNGLRLYIGDPNVILDPGGYEYTIVYMTSRQLGFFGGKDELYWNVTGNGWVFPIDKVTAEVFLPKGVPPDKIAVKTFAGTEGSTSTTAQYSISPQPPQVSSRTTQPLDSSEGLTIAVQWPEGFVHRPSGPARTANFLYDNRSAVIGVLGLILVLAYYVATWSKVGNDPERGTIIPQWEIPDGLSPAAIRFIRRMGFDNKGFASALLDMAVKRYIKIVQDGKEYTIEKDKADAKALAPEEQNVADSLLKDQDSIVLKNTNHTEIAVALASLSGYLTGHYSAEYFARNTIYILPGLVFSGLIVYLSAIAAPVTGVVGVLAVAFLIINGIFLNLLRCVTIPGRRFLDKVEGLRMYLTTAEQDRLNALNPPERTPELFEQFLPYALALDVEEQWAEQFADVLAKAGEGGTAYSPAWYFGGSYSNFGSSGFASAVGSSLAGAVASSSMAPGSSSGFGGGGSSGGGGGGGGGGGW